MPEPRLAMEVPDRRAPYLPEAACYGYPPDAFFPGEGPTPVWLRELCSGCVHNASCLQWALENREHGIWAGTNDAERKAMRRGAA